jgi:glycosyltransferase involved in cell wall biosynthesis
LAAHRAGIPSVWNVRESEDPEHYFDYLPPFLQEMAYGCFSLARRVVFVSKATQDIWARYDGRGCFSLVSNGLDAERMVRRIYGTERSLVRLRMGLAADDILLLSVGTVSERKGQQDLVEAMENLDPALRNHLVLALIGFTDSDYSNRTRQQLERLERDRVIRAVMHRETSREEDAVLVAESFLAADIFVLNSRFESYPRVILEAMAFALPVVTTPCFGVAEQVIDQETALVYPPGEIRLLSDCISRLCSDHELRHRLGQAGFKRLSNLNSYKRMLETYEDIYASCFRLN